MHSSTCPASISRAPDCLPHRPARPVSAPQTTEALPETCRWACAPPQQSLLPSWQLLSADSASRITARPGVCPCSRRVCRVQMRMVGARQRDLNRQKRFSSGPSSAFASQRSSHRTGRSDKGGVVPNMRKAILLTLAAMMVVPAGAARRVTVAQLAETLAAATAEHRSDEDIARQVGGLELSERLTGPTLDRFAARLPLQPHTALALQLLADQSAFLDPPAGRVARHRPSRRGDPATNAGCGPRLCGRRPGAACPTSSSPGSRTGLTMAPRCSHKGELAGARRAAAGGNVEPAGHVSRRKRSSGPRRPASGAPATGNAPAELGPAKLG